MTGTLWIASYVVLCLTVACLSLAIAVLYRYLGKPANTPSRGLVWPLMIMPGHSFDALQLSNSSLSMSAAWQLDYGFYLLCTPEIDSYAAAMSLATVSRRWSYPYLIVVREGEVSPWIQDLPADIRDQIVWVTADSFASLGASFVPVTVFVRARHIVEAGIGLTSPSLLNEHFGFVQAFSVYDGVRAAAKH